MDEKENARHYEEQKIVKYQHMTPVKLSRNTSFLADQTNINDIFENKLNETNPCNLESKFIENSLSPYEYDNENYDYFAVDESYFPKKQIKSKKMQINLNAFPKSLENKLNEHDLPFDYDECFELDKNVHEKNSIWKNKTKIKITKPDYDTIPYIDEDIDESANKETHERSVNSHITTISPFHCRSFNSDIFDDMDQSLSPIVTDLSYLNGQELKDVSEIYLCDTSISFSE